MNTINADIIDLVFDLKGEMLAADYPFDLWNALLQHLPFLSGRTDIGVLPVRDIKQSATTSLPKRAKLALRIPANLADTATQLSGKQLLVSGSKLRLGDYKMREIKHYPTIHAQLVTGNRDETNFINEINQQLITMDITGKIICGLRHRLTGQTQEINGYSLVLHDLSAEASLKLQYQGLGNARHFGCGIFVPYKVISSRE